MKNEEDSLKAETRKPGYYWVKIKNNDYGILYWWGQAWQTFVKDYDFEEIDEHPIDRAEWSALREQVEKLKAELDKVKAEWQESELTLNSMAVGPKKLVEQNNKLVEALEEIAGYFPVYFDPDGDLQDRKINDMMTRIWTIIYSSKQK